MIEMKNIEKYRTGRGLKKADMARLFGVESQVYNNWVYRDSLPKEQYARAMEVLGQNETNVSELNRPAGLVPVISWVKAGEWCESPDNFAPGDSDEWLMCPSRHSPGTYALKVSGDSMTSSTPGDRSYPHGTIIFVDPDRAYQVGSRVIARLPGSAEATFKVYSEDAGVPYLMPINPRYPAIRMPEGTKICGVVIGSYWSE